MRRPFLWPGASLVLGILSGRFFSPSESVVLMALLVLFPFLWMFRNRRPFLPLFMMAVAGLGVVRIQQVQRVPANDLSRFASEDWVALEGKVVSLPETKVKGRREILSFVLEAKDLVRKKNFYEVRGLSQVFLFNPRQPVSFGSLVRLRGRLSLPKRARNPGEFDYRRYLGEQGVHSVFEGYGPRSLRILETNRARFSPLVFVQRLRETGARRLNQLYPFPLNVLEQALIFGIRKGLPENLRDDFMKTGTSHLVAISGMNITLVAGSLFFLSLCLGLPQKGAAVMGILATAAYVFLSGAGIPVVRAGWMAGLFFVGLLLERRKDFLNTLFFALVAILMIDPAALFQVGFQLSFLSVLSLVILAQGRFSLLESADWFQTGIVLIGTFPLCLVYFNVFSWASLFANLLAVPLFNLGVLGGWASLLAGKWPVIGPFLIQTSVLPLKAGLAWIRFWAAQPWGYLYVRPPSWAHVAFYYSTLIGFCLGLRFKQRLLSWLKPFSVSLWLLAAGSFFLPTSPETFVLHVFSAGQNELLHIEFPGKRHWLVNTGRSAPTDQARWILAPFLRREGVKHLEGILLTDFSKRHTGGLRTLFSNFSVGTLLFPESVKGGGKIKSELTMALWGQKGKNRLALQPDDRLPVSPEAQIQVLDIVEGYAFLLIHVKERRILFLPTWKPDILKPVLPKIRALSFVDILILPAQGEPLSAQWNEVLSSLLPAWVVLAKPQSGSRPVVETLKREEIPLLFLSETGALRFALQGKEWLVSAYG